MGVYYCFSKSILLFLRGRAGLTKDISFFLLLIGLEGCIVYNTVLENSYDNIL
jgi:hypothetical protein